MSNLNPNQFRVLSHEQLLARGADGHLGRAVEMDVPLHKIDGREPVPAMEGGYKKGRQITQPVEVMHQAHTDSYMLYAGNHRVRQAEVNGQSHIRAFVEPEDGNFNRAPFR